MQKRKHTHLKAAEGLILSMRKDGLTLQEIADELGLKMKNWSYRHNYEGWNLLYGIAPKPTGRPRRDGQPPKQDIEKELKRLRMEKTVSDFSAVNRKEVRPKAKYAVIYRHRNEYSISVMCQFFEVSRSGYYDYIKRMRQPEKDVDLAKEIQMCQDATDKTYGYRRVWLWLEHKNIHKTQKRFCG